MMIATQTNIKNINLLMKKSIEQQQEDIQMDLNSLIARTKEDPIELMRANKSQAQLLHLTKIKLQNTTLTPQDNARNSYQMHRQGVDCEQIRKMINEEKITHEQEMKEKRSEIVSEFYIPQLKGYNPNLYIEKYTKLTLLTQIDQLTKNRNNCLSKNYLMHKSQALIPIKPCQWSVQQNQINQQRMQCYETTVVNKNAIDSFKRIKRLYQNQGNLPNKQSEFDQKQQPQQQGGSNYQQQMMYISGNKHRQGNNSTQISQQQMKEQFDAVKKYAKFIFTRQLTTEQDEFQTKDQIKESTQAALRQLIEDLLSAAEIGKQNFREILKILCAQLFGQKGQQIKLHRSQKAFMQKKIILNTLQYLEQEFSQQFHQLTLTEIESYLKIRFLSDETFKTYGNIIQDQQTKIHVWGVIYVLLRAGKEEEIIHFVQGYIDGGGKIDLQYFCKIYELYLRCGLNKKQIARVHQDVSAQQDNDVFKHQIYLILTKDPKVEEQIFVSQLADYLWMNLKTVVLDEKDLKENQGPKNQQQLLTRYSKSKRGGNLDAYEDEKLEDVVEEDEEEENCLEAQHLDQSQTLQEVQDRTEQLFLNDQDSDPPSLDSVGYCVATLHYDAAYQLLMTIIDNGELAVDHLVHFTLLMKESGLQSLGLFNLMKQQQIFSKLFDQFLEQVRQVDQEMALIYLVLLSDQETMMQITAEYICQNNIAHEFFAQEIQSLTNLFNGKNIAQALQIQSIPYQIIRENFRKSEKYDKSRSIGYNGLNQLAIMVAQQYKKKYKITSLPIMLYDSFNCYKEVLLCLIDYYQIKVQQSQQDKIHVDTEQIGNQIIDESQVANIDQIHNRTYLKYQSQYQNLKDYDLQREMRILEFIKYLIEFSGIRYVNSWQNLLFELQKMQQRNYIPNYSNNNETKVNEFYQILSYSSKQVLYFKLVELVFRAILQCNKEISISNQVNKNEEFRQIKEIGKQLTCFYYKIEQQSGEFDKERQVIQQLIDQLNKID